MIGCVLLLLIVVLTLCTSWILVLIYSLPIPIELLLRLLVRSLAVHLWVKRLTIPTLIVRWVLLL